MTRGTRITVQLLLLAATVLLVAAAAYVGPELYGRTSLLADLRPVALKNCTLQRSAASTTAVT
jgi:hypothetical protein